MSELARGERLDERFSLLRPLGSGGMGEVWLVRDALLDQDLVAKLPLPGASEQAIELLKRECRLLRSLSHPNIVPLYEFHSGDPAGRRPFLTMAYVEGKDLSAYRLREPAEILRLARGVAAALDYAHRRGIVHRDLKATNVLVDDDSGEPRLCDFGLAGILRSSEKIDLRGGGSRFHVSPQQMAGESPQPADDIYAFGVLLYDLLSGQPPFWPEIDEDRLRFERPAPLTSPHELPDGLATVVARMLSKDPSARPRDMSEVGRELERCSSNLEPHPIASPKREEKLTPPPRVASVQVGSAIPSTLPSSSTPKMKMGRAMGWGTFSVFLALAALAFGVFFLLPDWVAQRGPVLVPAAEPVQAEAAPPTQPIEDPIEDLKRQAYVKDRAEKAREPVRRGLEELRSGRASEWGGAPYRNLQATFGRGESQLEAGDYAGAEATFRDASSSLPALRDRARAVLQEALEAGQRALAAGRSAEARAAFELAAAIAPGDGAARQGRERAGKLDEVVSYLSEGAGREQRGDLSGAVESYRRAVSLDPLSRAAQESLAGVDARATEASFNAAMSEGIAALDRRAFEVARGAFERAAAIQPSSQASDGMARAEEGLRLEAIAGHRDRAKALEAREDWRPALAEYEKVLSIDATIRFAQQGRERSLWRAELDEKLTFHLSHRERFSDENALEEARALLSEASEVEGAGARLREQLVALGAAVAEASVPIRVLLESDNLTDVMVYRIGSLGKFFELALELRPGTYSVIGSRRGYRDVRYQLMVVAGEPPKPLMIRCEEEI